MAEATSRVKQSFMGAESRGESTDLWTHTPQAVLAVPPLPLGRREGDDGEWTAQSLRDTLAIPGARPEPRTSDQERERK